MTTKLAVGERCAGQCFPCNTQSVQEDTATAITGISVDDEDLGSDDIKVSLSAEHGSLTLGVDDGLIFEDAAGDHSMTFTGSLDDVNAALASLSYTGDLNYFGRNSITIVSDDQGSTGLGGAKTDTDVIEIEVEDVLDNGAPENERIEFITTEEAVVEQVSSSAMSSADNEDPDSDALTVSAIDLPVFANSTIRISASAGSTHSTPEDGEAGAIRS